MKESGRRRIRVVNDPELTMASGFSLSTHPVFAGEAPSEFGYLDNWDVFDGALLSISFVTKGNTRTEGSAALVAPGVAVCARHVFEGHMRDLRENGLSAYATGIRRASARLWWVHKISPLQGYDVCLLGLSLRTALESGDSIARFPISARLPEVGDQISIYGFRSFSESYARHSDGETDIRKRLYFSKGKISRIWSSGRDRVLQPYPVFEVSCQTLGGMSGAPALNSAGQLIGVVSSSIEGTNAGPSYLTPIQPTLSVRFEGGWPAGLFGGTHSLLDIDPNFCTIDGRELFNSCQPEIGSDRSD
jgi:hypothetical protein